MKKHPHIHFNKSLIHTVIFLLSFMLAGCQPTKTIGTQPRTSLPADIQDDQSDSNSTTKTHHNNKDSSNSERSSEDDAEDQVPGGQILSRVFCENGLLPEDHLVTFRSDANEQLLYSSVKFFYKNKQIKNLSHPQVLSSIESQTELVFESRDFSIFEDEKNKKISFFFSTADTNSRENSADLFLTIPYVEPSTGYSLSKENLNSEISKVSMTAKWIATPSVDLKKYELRDLSTFDVLKAWDISAKDASVASFSADGRLIAFYEKVTSTDQLHLSIYSTEDDHKVVLPFSQSSKKNQVQFAPAITDASIYWIEKITNTNNQQVYQLKLLSIDQGNRTTKDTSSINPIILSTLDHVAPYLSLINDPYRGYDTLIYSSHGDYYFLTIDKTSHAIISTKKVVLPEYLKQKVDNISLNRPSRIIHLPWTDQILIDLGLQGGVISYNYAKDEWTPVGLINPVNRCLNASAGPDFSSRLMAR